MITEEVDWRHVFDLFPRDPTPRLMYADWLERHGHYSRAAAVRRTIALTGLDSGRVAEGHRGAE